MSDPAGPALFILCGPACCLSLPLFTCNDFFTGIDPVTLLLNLYCEPYLFSSFIKQLFTCNDFFTGYKPCATATPLRNTMSSTATVKTQFPRLHFDKHSNYLQWCEHVKDFIYANDNATVADVWEVAQWDLTAHPDVNGAPAVDPADTDYSSPAATKKAHAKLFCFIRQHLSDAVMQASMQWPRHVPKFLRKLRAKWNDGSTISRDDLRRQMTSIKLADYQDLDEYITNFEQLVFTCVQYKIFNTDYLEEEKLFYFNRGLPETPDVQVHKNIVTSDNHGYDAAVQYYRNRWKTDSSLPGALGHTTTTDRSHATREHDDHRHDHYYDRYHEHSHSTQQGAICRDYTRGKCTRGDRCRFVHPPQPGSRPNSARDGVLCSYCGKPNHTEAVCYKKKREEKEAKAQESVNASVGDAGVASPSAGSIQFYDAVFAHFDDQVSQTAIATAKAIQPTPGKVTLLLDGASTCAVVQNEAHCTNVVKTTTRIKVGQGVVNCHKTGDFTFSYFVDGLKNTTTIPARIVPDFGCNIIPESFYLKKNIDINKSGNKCTLITRENRVVLRAVAAPNWLFYFNATPATPTRTTLATTTLAATQPGNFGVNQRKMAELDGSAGHGRQLSHSGNDSLMSHVATHPGPGLKMIHSLATKFGPQKGKQSGSGLNQRSSTQLATCENSTTEGSTHQDLANSTHSTTLRQNRTGPIDFSTPDSSYFFINEALDGEREAQILLPYTNATDSSYFTKLKDDANLLLLLHQRQGHRNFRDVATQHGLTLPKKTPECISCIRAKSKRHALTHREWNLLDSPRFGYSIAWDFIGPFGVKTLDGNSIGSLKVDVYSKKLFLRMRRDQAVVHIEWGNFIAMLKAKFGKQVVANLITDRGPNLMSSQMKSLNALNGIIHIAIPAYTQELNITERHIKILIDAANAMMLAANAPACLYGECLMYAAYAINTCPAVAGGKLSRNEKAANRLLPDDRTHLRVWGCAFYAHKDHGTRGFIGPRPSKQIGEHGAKAVEMMQVGIDENGLGYRVARIHSPRDYKVSTRLHGTHVESRMPMAELHRQRTLTHMTPDQTRRYADTIPSEPLSSLPDAVLDQDVGLRRSRRAHNPTGAALRARADVDDPPEKQIEDETAAFTQLIDCEPMYDAVSEIIHAISDKTLGAPRRALDAMTGANAEKWIAAIIKEYDSHVKHETFGPPLGTAPPGFKAIPFDVIFKTKRDGTRKARGIMKGFHMRSGIDFNDTFAPVPCLTVIRALLAIATKHDWEIKQGDVSTAFLSADMDTEMYIKVPRWFCGSPSPTQVGHDVRRVLKAIPGCPQGPRLFNRKTHSTHLKLGLVQCKTEFALYKCEARKLYLVTWVDDYFLFFPTVSTPHAKELWANLQADFDLGEWQDIDDCLGVKISRDRPNRRLSLSQRDAMVKILEKAGMTGCNTEPTPMVAGLKLSKKDCPDQLAAITMEAQQKWYICIVACLIYPSRWTRPDLSQAVSKLCQFMHNPGTVHMTALKRLLRYCAGTLDLGLLYDFSTAIRHELHRCGVYGLYDASRADCQDTMRTTLAYCSYLEACLLSWHTKRHATITTATNHSEYCAAAKMAREAKYLDKIFVFLGQVQAVRPIDLFSDSKGAIAMSYNPVNQAASKHVDLADHYAREMVDLGIITISYIDTKKMIADLLTKPLGRAPFERLVVHLVRSTILA